MNKTYFALHLRRCLKPWLAITIFLCLFVTIVCAAFTPESISSFEGVVGDMAVGNIIKDTTLEGFFANIFYAVIGMIFPMVYTAFVANKLVVKEVDSGAMASWLTTPVDRITYSITGAVFLMVSQLLMFCCVLGVGIVAAAYFQPNVLDLKIFSYLILGGFLYHFAIGGLCYFSSCLCNTTGRYLLLGAALPLAFIFLNIIRRLVESLEFLKYLTLNTLLDTDAILNGSGFWIQFIVLTLIGIIFYIIAIQVFRHKDLSI